MIQLFVGFANRNPQTALLIANPLKAFPSKAFESLTWIKNALSTTVDVRFGS